MSGDDPQSQELATLPMREGAQTERRAQIARYIVVETLGHGQMGEVLRAYDPKLRREVALKLVRGTIDAEATTLAGEAQAMAQLSHPNIVAVYDVDSVDDRPFIVMEFVQGTTLQTWLSDDDPDWRSIVTAFVAAGRGLSAAHAAGLVHRDFKPANVMRATTGRIQVMDFGLARAPDLATAIAGTPAYMAPEQHRGESVDARGDQYALCVALFEALAGQRPFSGGDLLAAKLTTVPDTKLLGRSVPVHIREAIGRGLSADPAQRFVSVDALLAALDDAPSRRRRALFGVGALALGTAVWAGLVWQSDRSARRACRAEAETIQTVWNDARRQQLTTVFAASGAHNQAVARDKTVQWLDDHATRWQETTQQSCSVGSGSGSTDPRIGTCLTRLRGDLDAVVTALLKADAATVQRATKAAARLPAASRCTDPDWLVHQPPAPAQPETVQALAHLHDTRSGAAALSAAGEYDAALVQARVALNEARAIGWAPALADALLSVAALQETGIDYPEARDTAHEAFVVSLGAGYDLGALSAAARLIFVVGYGLSDHDAGLRWSEAGFALADRLGYAADHPGRLALLNNTAVVHRMRGAYAEALQMQTSAVQIKRDQLGQRHPALSGTLSNLAVAMLMLGDLDGAAATLREALTIATEALGPNHPDVASIRDKLGSLANERGDFETALDELTAALKISEAALGADHNDVGGLLSNLARVQISLGDPQGALASTGRALAIADHNGVAEHPDTAVTLDNHGLALAAIHERARACSAWERALRIKRASMDEDHPQVLATRQRLAGCPTADQ